MEYTAAAARQQLSERDAEAKRFTIDSADLKQQLELVWPSNLHSHASSYMLSNTDDNGMQHIGQLS